jgi:ABC-type Co2+ transport system permease subunit
LMLELPAGHPQISYFTGLVPSRTSSHAVGIGARARELGWPTVALCLGTFAAAAQLLPGAELASLTYRRGARLRGGDSPRSLP